MAIGLIIELDENILKEVYPKKEACMIHAYDDIKKALAPLSFTTVYNSLFISDKDNIVISYGAVDDLVRNLSWFAESVKELRLIIIDSIEDMKPIIPRIVRLAGK
jgi:virulence-associated protein VapD